MEKTSTVRIFASSVLETIWATGVGSVVGHLSTKAHSTHNKAVLSPSTGTAFRWRSMASPNRGVM
ncbi:hypothetical protein [Shewanella sp. Isolate7]|uniref:hypothetical protein n=1 Tax=Shewanella sp. Isolate7 TaxID=2908528 RepID=UPI001EFE0B23|nr:hypothetical protein [Shewanella sp. Isolate7]MCG9723470.1 hypothetical protein [Shewanella sp. Isolate7]